MAIVIGTGSFLLVFSLGINLIALLVPYWIKEKNFLGLNYDNFGLWGACSCKWYYHDFDDIKDSQLDAWFQAAQWLYAAAVAIIGITMLTIFILSCCSEKGYARALTAAGALMLVAAVLIAVAVVVFAVMGHQEKDYSLDKEPRLSWGMWVAVAGFGTALVTSIVFLVQGSRI